MTSSGARYPLHTQLNPRNHTAVCDECSEARSEYARKLRLRRS